ncbi:MAG: hypothetical protein IJN11_07445 [Oscillospiraceae bacterium]|nr:hypothetical protein [Oscillospiraceae bacterium]
MKKQAFVLALAMLLCGCSANQTKPKEMETTTLNPTIASVETTETPETATNKIYDVELKTSTEYGSFEGFLRSDLCKKMQQDGFTVYALSYDEERFTGKGVTADACFYMMGIRDALTEKGVICSITYNSYVKTAEELSRNAWDTSGDSIVTVEKDGVNYDVYISKTPYVDYDEYSIAYIPFEGYILDIHPRASTPEEALAYIHEFDLVPVTAEGEIAETTAAQETETTPEETAAPAETEATKTEPTPETIPETTPETNENPPAETPAEPE